MSEIKNYLIDDLRNMKQIIGYFISSVVIVVIFTLQYLAMRERDGISLWEYLRYFFCAVAIMSVLGIGIWMAMG